MAPRDDFPPAEEILPFSVVGDVHGSLPALQHAVSRTLRAGLRTLVQVGDFWLYENAVVLHKLDRMVATIARNSGLSPGEFQIYFADGNHEDFDVLDPDADEPVRMSEHLTYVPRGLSLEIEGTKVGFLGGAESIDRDARTHGSDWWPAERMTYGQFLRAYEEMGEVDVLITHDTTHSVFRALAARSGHAEAKVEVGHFERESIGEVISKVRPRWHVHGHHHTFGVFDHEAAGTRTLSLSSDARVGAGAVLGRHDLSLTAFDGRLGRGVRMNLDLNPVRV